MAATRRPSRVTNQVRVIRKSLSVIDRALGRLVTVARAAEKADRSSLNRRRRTLDLSPARRAALKLQGQYMGYLRNLSARQKSAIKALRVKKGLRAAIAQAKRLGKS